MEETSGPWRRSVGKTAAERQIRPRRGDRREAPEVGSRRGDRCRRDGNGRSLRTRRAGTRNVAARGGRSSAFGLEQSQVGEQPRVGSLGRRFHAVSAACAGLRGRAIRAAQEHQEGSGQYPRRSCEWQRFHVRFGTMTEATMCHDPNRSRRELQILRSPGSFGNRFRNFAELFGGVGVQSSRKVGMSRRSRLEADVKSVISGDKVWISRTVWRCPHYNK